MSAALSEVPKHHVPSPGTGPDPQDVKDINSVLFPVLKTF